MKKEDFYYYYFTEYLAELTKEMFIRKNWCDEDTTYFHTRYLQDLFIAEESIEKMEQTLGRPLADDECIRVLVGLRKTRIEKSYNFILSNFLEHITEQKSLNPEDQLKIEKRLLKHKQSYYSLDLLIEMKNIEEEILRR